MSAYITIIKSEIKNIANNQENIIVIKKNDKVIFTTDEKKR